MPLAESIKRRNEPRGIKRDQVQDEYEPSIRGFDLSKVYFVAHHVPLEDESGFKYVKHQGDRMVHAMLDALTHHRLHQMVLVAMRSYDDSIKDLATNEEMERFALHLVGKKTMFVNEQMLGAFSTLLRTERLKYPHGSKEVTGYIVSRFNEDRPLTKKVVAVVESGEIILMPIEAYEGDVRDR